MSINDSKVGVAIVGCGTVGGATAQILASGDKALGGKVAADIDLRYMVDLDFTHAKSLGIDEKLFCNDLQTALDDDSVSIIVELVGGTTFARELIIKSLRAGKHVVTANKALLAHHGEELWAIARENGVSIGFEASCAGGIPIIQSICGGLISNRIDAIFGIVNGTCNYILTAMTQLGQSYAEALAEAQADGLAEADPTLDVAGIDSAHKLAIMAALAFGQKIDFDAIPTIGIDELDIFDIQYGQELGYVVKLLAIAQRQKNGLSLRVRPAFISKSHPLAWVSGPFNAISIYGDSTGHTMYYGRGAGGLPTGSAVVSDIAAIAIGTIPQQFNNLNIWPDLTEPANQLAAEDIQSRYYLRMTVDDHPGVLANIASILGKYGISICSVLQHEHTEVATNVPVVITTYRACQANMIKAIQEVDALDVSKAPTVSIAILDEHPEQLD